MKLKAGKTLINLGGKSQKINTKIPPQRKKGEISKDKSK